MPARLPRRASYLACRPKLSRRVGCGGVGRDGRQHLTVARVAEGLGVAWNTANDAVLAEGKRVLIDDPTRLDGVTAIGVDERLWRRTRQADRCHPGRQRESLPRV